MPIMDGITATQIIGQKFPSIRVIALTSFDDEPLVQSAQQAGIHDYLLKNVTIDKIVDTIRNAYLTSNASG